MNSLNHSVGTVVTFHREGILAHTTLRSYFLARRVAAAAGVDVRFYFIADKADAHTISVLRNHPELDGTEQVLEVDVGDLALARNIGVQAADTRFVCTLDGDDLVSRNYFAEHARQLAQSDEGVILHPEMVVSFGMYNAFNWQADQTGPYFSRESLMTVNPWISAAFARHEVFERTPYAPCYPTTTGFGYEDWYWNCETVARGHVHRLAWGTAYFYRRKLAGSLNESSRSLNAVMPKTSLFARTQESPAC